jgi:hypothetical protein
MGKLRPWQDRHDFDDGVSACACLSWYPHVIDRTRFPKGLRLVDEVGIRNDRFSYLAEVMGPDGLSFDKDLPKDPVSQVAPRVSGEAT